MWAYLPSTHYTKWTPRDTPPPVWKNASSRGLAGSLTSYSHSPAGPSPARATSGAAQAVSRERSRSGASGNHPLLLQLLYPAVVVEALRGRLAGARVLRRGERAAHDLLAHPWRVGKLRNAGVISLVQQRGLVGLG